MRTQNCPDQYIYIGRGNFTFALYVYIYEGLKLPRHRHVNHVRTESR